LLLLLLLLSGCPQVSNIMRDGVPQRFCQQCGRFHPLQDFDGAKRSCRARWVHRAGDEAVAQAGTG
jgi:hypothetical protein